jgi:tetratricopeptide (TPR) repeat protein
VRWHRGEYDLARPLLEEGLQSRKKENPESPDVASTLNRLGAIAYKRGDLAAVHTDNRDPAGARPLLERALRIQEKSLGPKHPDLASPLMNLGHVVSAAGDNEAGARPYYERAIAILEESTPTNPERARALDRLAWNTLGSQRDGDGVEDPRLRADMNEVVAAVERRRPHHRQAVAEHEGSHGR